MKLTRKMKSERQITNIANIKKYVKEGDTVYTSLQSVSSNGMSRRIKVFIVHDNQIIDITWWTANAIECRYNNKKEALVISGCGMDMGYHVVYSLATVLRYKKSGMGSENVGNCYGLNHRWL